MNEAKIRLSQKEAELVANADFILTKNEILKKTRYLLEKLMKGQQGFLQSAKPDLPNAILLPAPKISKGENYKGLPYLILDHPRYFDKENVFAIRTMFLWGNFFSITLHLSGSCKEKFENKVAAAYKIINENDIYCCVNDYQWEHHFENDNYLPTRDWNKNDFEKFIRRKKFIKLAQKFPLAQWDDAPSILLKYFKLFIRITGSRC